MSDSYAEVQSTVNGLECSKCGAEIAPFESHRLYTDGQRTHMHCTAEQDIEAAEAAAVEDVAETYNAAHDDTLIELAATDPANDGMALLARELARRLKARIQPRVDLVGTTEVPHDQLELHQLGVYRITPPGWEPGDYNTGPGPYYVRYLRVPGGWVVDMDVPGYRGAGLRATFVPDTPKITAALEVLHARVADLAERVDALEFQGSDEADS